MSFVPVSDRKFPWCAQHRAPAISGLFLVAAVLASTLSCSQFRSSDAAAKSMLDRGKADYAAQRYSDAARQFREVVRLQPDSPEGHYWLGITLRAMDQQDEAMAELYRAHLAQNNY